MAKYSTSESVEFVGGGLFEIAKRLNDGVLDLRGDQRKIEDMLLGSSGYLVEGPIDSVPD